MPRWLQAFPKATIIRPSDLATVSAAAAIVWLRLDPAVPVLDQVVALRKSAGEIRVIVLANHPNDEEALSLFAAGILGYCNAHATAANLRQVASVVREGGLWIGQALMHRLLVSTQTALMRSRVGESASDAPASARADPLSALTAREQEVARAVANGASNKEIAREMGITERTIKAHASAIFQKLKARDRLHLALIVNGHRPA